MPPILKVNIDLIVHFALNGFQFDAVVAVVSFAVVLVVVLLVILVLLLKSLTAWCRRPVSLRWVNMQYEFDFCRKRWTLRIHLLRKL